jgi:hypothetical protein
MITGLNAERSHSRAKPQPSEATAERGRAPEPAGRGALHVPFFERELPRLFDRWEEERAKGRKEAA